MRHLVSVSMICRSHMRNFRCYAASKAWCCARAVFAICLSVALLGSSVVLSSCALFENTREYSLVEQGVLHVVVPDDGAPFVYQDSDSSELTGYTVALAQEVASRLGLTCSVETMDKTTIVSTLNQGKFDIALSLSLTVMDMDDARITYAYYVGSQAIVVSADSSFDQLEDLEKKKVATVAHTEGNTYACEVFDEDNVLVYASVDRCFEALQRGWVQGVLVNTSQAQVYLQDHDGTYDILEYIATDQRYGAVVPAENEALETAINEVLHDMDEDGTLQWLQAEYLLPSTSK